MSGQVTITGCDVVQVIEIMSPSGADAGRIWARAAGSISLPERGIDIVATTINVTMQWSGCRLVKRPNVFRSGAEFVLEDSRWKMRDTYLAKSYNKSLIDGRVIDSTDLADIWQDIADLSGILIRTENLPSLNPPLLAGMSCRDAADLLLKQTVCRMVYDPVTGEYAVSPAGTGASPSVTNRLRKQVATILPAAVRVHSAPRLYESEITCEAVVVEGDGTIVEMDGNAEFDLIDFFNGFEDANDDRRELLTNGAFRMWRPVSVAFPEALDADEINIVGHRIASLGPGEFMSPQAIATGMTDLPRFHYVPTDKTLSLSPVHYNPESGLFISRDPVIAVAAGDIQTEVGIVCAYQKTDGGSAERATQERAVSGGTGTEVDVYVPWITPVSTESDKDGVDEDYWESNLSDIADAYEVMYSAPAERVRIRSLLTTDGSGQVGAVRYRAMIGSMAKLETTMYLNHVPSGATPW